jgi:streptogramin lyase
MAVENKANRGPTALVAAALAGISLLVASCSPPATNPDGTVPQSPPLGVNGMVEDPDPATPGVWIADLFGQQMVRFDPDTGAIEERYGMAEGLCGTDDIAVMPDASLVATCPTSGLVVRVPRGGTAEVLDAVGRGANPIVAHPDGDSVLVGFGTEERDELLRVYTDGRATEVVADDLPVLNGFGFGPDGLLYVPTGGAGGLLGTGGLGTIDITTGTFSGIPLAFSEPGKTGFDFACGADVAPDGTVFVAQCANAAAYSVDPATGAAELVGRAATDFVDNVVRLTDGRVLLSSFFGGTATVFTPAGAGWDRSLLAIGS